MDYDKSMHLLIADAEQLLSKLGDLKSPEIVALREKVESGIADTKNMIADQAQASAESIRKMTSSVVGYIQENPWVAIAAGTAIAVALVYVAFSSRDPREA
jgi:ElaB/YqjD/DUF883 family membrane-anchored ribosome-binding protein